MLFYFKPSSSVSGISHDPAEVLHVLSCSSSTHSSYAPLFLWLFSSWALLPQAKGSKSILPCSRKGRRVMWFTLFVQNPAYLFANVSNRKALLSKLMRNFKVRPRAVLHMDNNTQISGVSKLGGSSHYCLERLFRQTQVINILLEALCCQGGESYLTN